MTRSAKPDPHLECAGIDALPLALAELHLETRVGDQVQFTLVPHDLERVKLALVGAGFEFDRLRAGVVTATRLWSLPDFVGPGMRVLMCGLNPSPSSADCGVGFHKAGNRFWPAAIDAGLVEVDRDPFDALITHRMGMTDLVKRPTARAGELEAEEYRDGLERVGQLVSWLQPKAVCMVGLAGWRAAVDRTAQRGWQERTLGARPVYVMPSTSGLNAHDTRSTLAEHLRTFV